MGIETALIGGALAAAGSLGSAAIGADAAGGAADKATQAQREAIAAQKEQAARAEAFQREQAGIARADLQPFRDAQLGALGQLQGMADPNSAFATAQRDQATQAIQRQLAAQGLLRSKKQSDLLGNFELGLMNQRAGILQGIAGGGAAQQQAGISQSLGQGLAGNAVNLGNQIGSSFQNIGQIQAQGGMAQAQAIQGGLAGLNNAIQGTFSGVAAQQQNQFQNDFLKAWAKKQGFSLPGVA